MLRVVVHPHALKHGLTEKDVRHAWKNFVRKQHRSSPEEDKVLAIGPKANGQMVQMVGRDIGFTIVIYHAMCPPTKKVLRELGIGR